MTKIGQQPATTETQMEIKSNPFSDIRAVESTQKPENLLLCSQIYVDKPQSNESHEITSLMTPLPRSAAYVQQLYRSEVTPSIEQRRTISIERPEGRHNRKETRSRKPLDKKIVRGIFTRSNLIDFGVLKWTDDSMIHDATSVTHNRSQIVIYRNVKSSKENIGSFSQSAVINIENNTWNNWNYLGDIAAGDINNDGIDDIVRTDAHSNGICIHIGNGNGTFQVPIEIPTPRGLMPWNIALGNFSGSGKTDMAVIYLDMNSAKDHECRWIFAFHFGNNNGSFQDPVMEIESSWSNSADWNFHDTAKRQGKFFNFTTVKSIMRLEGGCRDAVSVNGVLRWWHRGIQGLPWMLGD